MSMEYIKENKNYYEEKINELNDKVKYYQNKTQRQNKEIERLNKFVDDILNFYKHNRYEEELTKDNMFKLVLNQNEMIMTIEEFKGDVNE